jgi:hypothetical protein
MTWIDRNGMPVESIPEEYIGFVYRITNNLDGREYIGKKLAKFSKTKMVKGKKKRFKIDSDWKEYWGSSELLKADIELLGAENFMRQIIHYCKNKGSLGYLEAREQMDRRVLENPDKFYNRQIMLRCHTKHVKLD